MSERLLGLLLQQAVLLGVGVVLMAALRPLLLKRLGAGSVYAAWLLVPALLLTPLLPRPGPTAMPWDLHQFINSQTIRKCAKRVCTIAIALIEDIEEG